MTKPLLLLLLLAGSLNLQATITESPSEEWCQKVQQFDKKSNLDSIVLFFEQTINSFEITKDWEKAADYYKEISQVFLGKNALKEEISEKEKKLVNQEFVRLLHLSLNQLKNRGFVPNETVGELYVYLALSYRRLDDYFAALKHYDKALQIFENLQWDNPIVAYAYKNAALTCSRMLEHDKQYIYLQKALQLKNNKKYIASIQNALIGLYTYLGTKKLVYNDSAYIHYQLGLEAAKNDYETAKLQTNVAGFLLPLNRNEEALSATLEALSYFQKENIHRHFDAVHSRLGSIYQNLKQKNKSIFHFNKALEWAAENSNKKNREKADFHTTFGNAYVEWGDTLKALQHYQQALIQVFPNFNETNVIQNPLLNEVYQESWIMTAAAKKAALLQKRYEKSNKIQDLKSAANSYNLSLRAIQYLHQSYSTDTSKHYLSDYSHNYYEQALYTNFLLYTQTQKAQYLDTAFQIMEQSKAKTLKEAMVKNKAFQKLPKSLRQQLKNLKSSMLDPKNSEKYDSLRLEYFMFEENIKNDPLYAKLFKPLFFQIPTIDSLQQQMPSTLIVEYFWGKDHLYMLQISPNKAQLDTLQLSDSLLQSHLRLLQKKEKNTSQSPHYLAYTLYQKYCSKWMNIKNEKINTIAIVPDGSLNFLPFEALVTDTLQSIKGDSFKEIFPRQWKYLLHQQPIYYAYSATVLLQEEAQKKQKEKAKILGFFPNFEGQNELLHQDADWFEGKFVGNYLNDSTASISRFKKDAPTAQVIHLSTHAYADSLPRIDFADGTFPLSDLYAMQLSAELVVLSACETGLGNLLKGEGAMSLARGFVYTGASNLMASLWSVDEKSTQFIVQKFYEELEEGQPKAVALQSAKIKYLEEFSGKDANFLPYYWGGMVYIGQNTPLLLKSKKNNWFWWISSLIALFALFAFGGLCWRMKK